MIFMGSTVPIIWAVLVLFAGLTVLLLYLGLFQDRSRGRPRCPKCWYNMTGAPSLICPECGHDACDPKRLHRTRRRRWAIVLSVPTPFCCYESWLVRVDPHPLQLSIVLRVGGSDTFCGLPPLIIARPVSGDQDGLLLLPQQLRLLAPELQFLLPSHAGDLFLHQRRAAAFHLDAVKCLGLHSRSPRPASGCPERSIPESRLPHYTTRSCDSEQCA